MFLRKDNSAPNETIALSLVAFRYSWLFLIVQLSPRTKMSCLEIIEPQTEEDVGLLVQVSFYITAFTLPAYQRGSLPRPSKDVSS